MAKGDKKKGIENLIPANKRTEDELREMTSKGGIKSGEARREKKKLKETLKALLELKDEATGEDNQAKLCLALFEKACKGDVQAFNSLRDTIGEKPVDKIEETFNGELNINVNFVD